MLSEDPRHTRHRTLLLAGVVFVPVFLVHHLTHRKRRYCPGVDLHGPHTLPEGHVVTDSTTPDAINAALAAMFDDDSDADTPEPDITPPNMPGATSTTDVPPGETDGGGGVLWPPRDAMWGDSEPVVHHDFTVFDDDSDDTSNTDTTPPSRPDEPSTIRIPTCVPDSPKQTSPTTPTYARHRVDPHTGALADMHTDTPRRRHSRAATVHDVLTTSQLDFYANLRRGDDTDPSRFDNLRPPMFTAETDTQRRNRQLRFAAAVHGMDAFRRGSKFRVTDRDLDTLQFIAMFRYATAAHVAAMASETVGTSGRRLRKLRSCGLVVNKPIYGTTDIWCLTSAGMTVIGLSLPRPTSTTMSMAMFPHQFTVNHIAANLWGGGVNVLALDDYPSTRHTDQRGHTTLGENLTSELQMQSAFGKLRAFGGVDMWRNTTTRAVDSAFTAYRKAVAEGADPDTTASPETLPGNEYMWILFPPFHLHLAYHVPDLVVRRPRRGDGTPASIAVEVEVDEKTHDSYVRTLSAYKLDSRLYRSVTWVCRTKRIATMLDRAARQVGITTPDMRIIPILTDTGVFAGRNLWTL